MEKDIMGGDKMKEFNMLEIVLAVLLGISAIGNIVLIKGVKIEVQQTQTQTTITDIENKNLNENVNTVNVGASGVSLTNIFIPFKQF